MSVHALISFGAPSFRAGSSLRPKRSATKVDTLTVEYMGFAHDDFSPNQVCPDFPGMIIREVDSDEEGVGCWSHSLKCEGSLDNSSPTKIIDRGEEDSVEGQFDSAQLTYLTWKGRIRNATGTASTDVISLADHRFINGDEVVFLSLAGGAGLAARTGYFVRDRADATFKLAATLGGSAIDFTTNITSGWIVLKTFAKGIATHPDHPYLYLTLRKARDANTAWQTLDCTFKGLLGGKPRKRTVSVGGRVFSRDDLVWNVEGGGWDVPFRGTGQMPEIVVVDVDVVTVRPDTSIVPTSDVLNAAGEEGRTIPPEAVIEDPEGITALYDEVAGVNLTLNYPNKWSLVDMKTLDSVPGASIWLRERTWKYIHRVTP